MTRALNSLASRDVAFVLHPYTNARKHEKSGPLVIERGEGIYVYDDQGKEYIEGLAGLWSVALGFSEKRLVDAATAQLNKLPYYHTFAHKSHPSSIDLAERLVALTDHRLSRVFFTNSGSEANDTVVKLLWYYNNAIGRPRKKKIIARQRGYHGITVASGSLSGLPWNHRDFDLPIANILHTACPHHYRYAYEGESEETFASRIANDLEELILREGPETVAGFIGEPLMAAGGVIVPPRTYWQKIQEVCRRYDVMIIADEVINGFGRTGKMFGCDTYGIEPDVMVLSKQLTSSYQPLSAVLFTDQLYQGIADNTAKIGTFGHGFTASGHPVATAVALESLKIFEERSLVARAAALAVPFQEGLQRFADYPLVGEVRGAGLVGAIEFVADRKTKSPFNAPGTVGAFIVERCLDHGLIARNIGDIIAFCPPLIIERAQIDTMFERFSKALDDTYRWLRQR